MIIGISGKIGSGKDTIGTIIQALTWRTYKGEKSLYDVMEWLNGQRKNSSDDMAGHNFKIVKFADKLKEIVSLMTGIPRQDLELQSVKDSYLPECWDRQMWPLTFRGTTSEFIKFMQQDNNLVSDGVSVQINHLEHIFNYHAIVKRMTVRQLLQEVGTNAIRNHVHQNAWVNATMVDYKPFPRGRYMENPTFNLPEAYRGTCQTCGESFLGYKRQRDCAECAVAAPDKFPNWIITDVRFENEAEAVESKGGILLRVVRPRDTSKDMVEHESETGLDLYTFQNTILNDGTIEELVEMVRLFLLANKIIS